MSVIACPIWGTNAIRLPEAPGFDGESVDSPRTGGRYSISGTATAMIRSSTGADKSKLTTWIVDQRRSGNTSPNVTSETVKQASSARALRISERTQRFFFLASALSFQPSDSFKVSGIVDDKYRRDTGLLSAWTECSEDSQLGGIVRLLHEEGLVNASHLTDHVTVTAKGFERMEALENGAALTTQAFVAMWFDQSMEDAYIAGVQPAIEEAGYKALRIDRKEHGNKIDDEIVAEIRRSRFIVADFTCGIEAVSGRTIGIARGGVYYEAGFAQGLRIPVIWSCRKDCIDYVHFDTRQFNHIVWDSPDDLKTKLLNRIRAMIT